MGGVNVLGPWRRSQPNRGVRLRADAKFLGFGIVFASAKSYARILLSAKLIIVSETRFETLAFESRFRRESALMFGLAVSLFGIAALGGIVLAILHFRDTPPPVAVSSMHGLLGLGGLAALIAALAQGDISESSRGLATAAAVVLGIAVAGGLFFLVLRLRGKSLPKMMIPIHGAAAAIGFALALVAFFAA